MLKVRLNPFSTTIFNFTKFYLTRPFILQYRHQRSTWYHMHTFNYFCNHSFTSPWDRWNTMKHLPVLPTVMFRHVSITCSMRTFSSLKAFYRNAYSVKVIHQWLFVYCSDIELIVWSDGETCELHHKYRMRLSEYPFCFVGVQIPWKSQCGLLLLSGNTSRLWFRNK